MKVIDTHCDVLCKMLLNPEIDFLDESYLDVTLPRLIEGNVKIQAFAVYLPEQLGRKEFTHIIKSIELFHKKILYHPKMAFVRTAEEMTRAITEDRIGALLTLEGADGLNGNLSCLHALFERGVRCLGITWNNANWAGDGVMEPRKGGLTLNGRRLVEECNKLGILLDVSHLSEKGFWELAECSNSPLMASHSNAFSICPNVRNLQKDQIECLIQMNGTIGLNFVPQFVNNTTTVQISDLLRHIDYICSLGGVNHLGFGSDFDGIDHHIVNLEHPGKYVDLYYALSKYYNDSDVEGFLFRNWFEYYNSNLPKKHDS